mgnify:CR=1 FL=1
MNFLGITILEQRKENLDEKITVKVDNKIKIKRIKYVKITKKS